MLLHYNTLISQAKDFFITNISSCGRSDGGISSSNSSNKSFRFRLSSSSLSPHLLGRYCVELELRPPGHQTNQLGRPARGLQPAPGKSNTGLPFPPGCVSVCACVRASCMCFDIRGCA